MVELSVRDDITLDVFERVAWSGEGVTISPSALERVDEARAAFLRLAARPEVTVYGVTSGYGDRAGVRLSEADRAGQSKAAALRAASFGEPLPARIARGIVLARLANLIEGNAGATGSLVSAVAGLLDGRDLPAVPSQGNGGSGEILALAHLFGPLMDGMELGEKEGLALINGSPCAAALVADSALAARRLIDLAYDVFALSVETYRSPLEAYDEALEGLWGDAFETTALRELRARLADDVERRSHQGPVGYRILPRVLGQAERVAATAADAAGTSLRSVTDNPVYLPPSPGFEDGRVLSTGGYHNAVAPASLGQLALCWAELGQLAERHVERLVFARPVAEDRDEISRLLMMVAVGYAEEARGAAQPVVLPRGGPGQNDVTSHAFLAWERERAAARSLTALLAILATAAVYELPDLDPSSALTRTWTDARAAAEAVRVGKAFGGELHELADVFEARTLTA